MGERPRLQVSNRRGAQLRGWVIDRGPRLLTAAALTWIVGWLLAMFLLPDGVIKGRFEDGGVYYQAGRAFLHGQNYYASPDFRQWPLLAALWAPLALLPPAVALRGWMLLTIAAIAGSVTLLVREHGPSEGKPGALWLVLTVGGPPALFMLYLGQMSGVCFAAYATALALLRRRPIVAGCCFALVAAKPHLVLLALPVLTTAALPAVLAFAGAMLIWPVGSLLVGGPGVFRVFLDQIYAVRDTTSGLVTSSLSSLVPLGSAHTVVQVVLLAALLLGTSWLALRRLHDGRRLPPAAVDVAALFALAALPYALVSELLFALPVLLRLGRRPPRWPWLLVPAWWLLPWLATLLTPRGGWWIAALLPPLVAVVGGFALLRPERFQIANHGTGDLSLGRSAGGDADLVRAT